MAGDKIKIDKGVPIPIDHLGARPRYPWASMAAGDSFFVPGKTAGKMASAVVGQRSRNGGTYTTRTVTEGGIRGCRVWRVS
jgi:hypothetical protein